MVAFGFGLSLVTALVSDAAGTAQHTRARHDDGQVADRREVGGQWGRVRSALVASQIALALALLVVAGLFSRSLANIGASISACRFEFDDFGCHRC